MPRCHHCGSEVPNVVKHLPSCAYAPESEKREAQGFLQTYPDSGVCRYEEGELPDHLKRVIKEKGSFLSEAEFEE